MAVLSTEERFWLKVRKSDGCWEWIGARNPAGYGKINNKHGKFGKPIVTDAHRASWILHHGPIPPKIFVCHRCDNPSCVRPDHLFLGTCRENTMDSLDKGRNKQAWPRTHCPKGHLFDKANTYLRPNKKTGGVARVCRICTREATRRWDHNRRHPV